MKHFKDVSAKWNIPMRISPKVNAIVGLDFELTYYYRSNPLRHSESLVTFYIIKN